MRVRHLSGCWVKEKSRCCLVSPEVEHRTNITRELVKGEVADPAGGPVVLNESDDGGLIGDAVIHIVLLRPWRNHQQATGGQAFDLSGTNQHR